MRYFRVILYLWRQSLIRELEFPKNFWFLVIVNTAHFTMQLIFIEILFSHTEALAGWNKGAVLTFLATWGIVTSILLLLCEQSFDDFGSDVHNGNFDIQLLRPVDAQVIVTFRRLALNHIAEPFFYLAVLGFLWFKGMIVITLSGVLGYLFLLTLGMIIGYHMWFALTSAIFWTPYVDNFNFLFTTIASITRYPLEIYSALGRPLLLTFLPIGLMVALPAEFLLGVGTMSGVTYAVFMTAIITLGTRLWWKFALRHYASASS